MKIRHATMEDLDTLAAIEAISYPKAEGASKESIKGRLEHFANAFWLLENDDGELVSFINGMLTNQETLVDDMYTHPEIHDENGSWLMIFSVVTNPKYRSHGYAGLLMRQVIEDLKAEKRKGIVLTCKEKMIAFYAQFGFINEGISVSTHGDVTWYQMRMLLEDGRVK